MLKSTANVFDKILRRYTPDPFIIALILTFFLLVLAYIITPASAEQLVMYWGDGFWSLSSFTLQMVMVLVGGYVVAASPFIDKVLHKLSSYLQNTTQAVILTTLVSLIGSWLNWGFGLVIGALLCKKISVDLPKANFRLLVASAYSGFLVWHAGLSASTPLLIATPGNFSETLMGGLIPVTDTIFSSYTLMMVACVSAAVLGLNIWISRKEPHGNYKFNEQRDDTALPKRKEEVYPVTKLENHFSIGLVTAVLGFAYIIVAYLNHKFILNLNGVNFIYLFLGLFLHKNPRSFLNAVMVSARKVGPILLQFPFYGALMGLMKDSGLAATISEAFIQFATPATFNVFTFWSAGVINLFIPSGGGQWAIQAPIIIPAAKTMGCDVIKATMAIAWGDAWTNMLQPFWALPVLAIAGLHLRDIMGYCVMVLIVSGLVLSGLFYFL